MTFSVFALKFQCLMPRLYGSEARLACLKRAQRAFRARAMLLWLELWPLLCGALLHFGDLGCPKTHVAFTTITEIDRLTYTDGLRHHFSYSKVSAGREASPEHSIRLLFSTL